MSLKVKLTEIDPQLLQLIQHTNHKILAKWAIECTLRVLPYFEKAYPQDHRPRQALETLQNWIDSGIFTMKVIRKASLDSHAAAREVGESAPCFAARAAGQAVATAHVPRHSLGAAMYALKAIADATNSQKAIDKERVWQYQRLAKLQKSYF